MQKYWQRSQSHKSSTDSVTSPTGFHDGYVYKIVNQYDSSVIHLDNYKSVDGTDLVTEEDTDNHCQRFRAMKIREGEEGGEFELLSMQQNPQGPNLVWTYDHYKKALVLKNATCDTKPSYHISTLPTGMEDEFGSDHNQLWIAVEKSEGSRIYLIKPKGLDVCLTNMGAGQPVGLYPMDASDLMQQWVLEPMDYADEN